MMGNLFALGARYSESLTKISAHFGKEECMLKKLTIILVMGIIVSMLIVSKAALAGPKACDKRVNDTHAKLMECVTLEGVRQHQAALQAIADANGGTRV